MRSAAASLAAVDPVPGTPLLSLPHVSVGPQHDNVERAIQFIRGTPISETLNTGVTEATYLTNLRQDYVARYPDQNPVPGESAAAWFERFGLLPSDIAQARTYLRNEHAAFRRTSALLEPGSNHVAGLAAPATPLPASVALAKTAGTRTVASNVTSTFITQASYRAIGAMQKIDYMRWGARKALKQSQSNPLLLTARFRPLMEATAQLAEGQIGRRRVTVWSTQGTSPQVYVRVHGTVSTDKFVVVGSLDGLRCVMKGNIEGAPCANPSSYILDSTPEPFQSGDVYSQQLDGTTTYKLTNPSGELYVLEQRFGSSTSTYDQVTGFDVTGITNTGLGGVFGENSPIAQEIADAINPAVDDASLPGIGCAGLPVDLGVPLESEITEDDDPYENSWQHYLDLADQMAREADALGEELIQAGLDGDLRAEAARDELESICGGVVNIETLVDGVSQPDPSLAHCLPGGEYNAVLPWVTFGDRTLCAWKSTALGLPCVCPANANDARCVGGVPVEGACPREPEEGQACSSVFPAVSGYDAITIGADAALGIADSVEGQNADPPQLVDCTVLRDLRDPDLTEDQRASAIVKLRRQPWFDWAHLQVLMDNAVYDEDFPYGLDVSVGGVALLALDDSDLPPESTEGCAGPGSWCEVSPTLFPQTVSPEDDAWRDDYIRGARRAFGMLAILSGSLHDNLRRSVVRFGQSCDESNFDPGVRICDLYERIDQEIFDCLDVGGCACLTTPEQGAHRYGNTPCDFARHDYPVDYAVLESSNEAVNDLWNVAEGVRCPAPSNTINEVLCSAPGAASFGFDLGSIFDIYSVFDWPDDDFFEDTPAWFLGEPADVHVPSIPNDYDDAVPTHDDVYDALALACYLHTQTDEGCPRFDANDPPPAPTVESVGDLRKVEDHVACAVESIRQSLQHAVVANVPEIIARSIREGQAVSLYPGFQGEHLEALTRVQADLNRIMGDMNTLTTLLDSGRLSTSNIRNALAQNDAQREIASLQTLAQALATTASAAAGAMSSFGATGALLPVQLLVDKLIADAQEVQFEAQEAGILLQYSSDMNDLLGNILATAIDVNDAIYALNADLESVRSLESRAQSAMARAAMLETDEASLRVFPVTSVIRRRYDSLQVRYERALSRARKMAFIARRAIEQRFGVDLPNMNQELTLVDSPAAWADDVCTFTGIDYERIRESVPAEEAPAANYADGYLGEYVDKLKLFVESYPFDFPFQDGSDLAVISLRDDIFRTKVSCEVPVEGNLLSWSSRFQQPGGPEAEDVPNPWAVTGCPVSQGVTEDCLLLDTAGSLVVPGRIASRVADLRPDGAVTFPGTLVQEVPLEDAPATLLLSWRAAYIPGRNTIEADPNATYKVRIESLETGTASEATFTRGAPPGLPALPDQETLSLVVLEPGTVRITIDPSSAAVRGDVWFSELQLEALPPDADVQSVEPGEYVETTSPGMGILHVCPDLDGAELRSLFDTRCQNLCPSGFGGLDCRDGGDGVIGQSCAYESEFAIDLGQIERGELIPSGAIALGNYNYRHDLVAVNLVGTNVRDCSQSQEPATCYSNAYLPITIEHRGHALPVRNHSGETLEFDFGVGYVEHGKALASEVVLTNPLTGAMDTLLQPYYKGELRGRPLTGDYRLRIWHDDALNWNNVEDIQLVFRYRYWTRFER